MDSWAVCLTEEAWAWRHDPNTAAVLAYLLGQAATDTCRHGYEILAQGDTITSHAGLAMATELTVKQVRLALVKLEDAQEVEAIRRPRGLLIRLLRYEDWRAIRANYDRRLPTGATKAIRRQATGGVKAGKGQTEGAIRAGKGQSHIINRNKEGFLTTNPPLSPPAENSAPYIRPQQNGKDGSCFEKSKEPRTTNAVPFPASKSSVDSSRPEGADATGFRERLQKFVSAERVFLSKRVLETICSESLEYIGLVYEAAVEKRDGKSNVIFPHAVARYRADQGVLPRKDTLDRLRKILHPPTPKRPSRIPQPQCPYCRGAGSVEGDPCECVGGRHRDACEIMRIEQERNAAIRQIRLQLNLVGESS